MARTAGRPPPAGAGRGACRRLLLMKDRRAVRKVVLVRTCVRRQQMAKADDDML